jgi:hypothetical protein
MKKDNENDLKKNLDTKSAEKLSDGGYVVEVTEDFIDKMINTDAEGCLFKRGDTVLKAVFNPGDRHAIDTPGIIIGTVIEKELGAAYLVQFANDELPCFTTEVKLKKEI